MGRAIVVVGSLQEVQSLCWLGRRVLGVAAFLRVKLQAPANRLDQLDRFYAEQLELRRLGDYRFRIGESELVVGVGEGEPFYHVALLVPGDRFDAALRWACARVELLPSGDGDDVVFDFDAWNALACTSARVSMKRRRFRTTGSSAVAVAADAVVEVDPVHRANDAESPQR